MANLNPRIGAWLVRAGQGASRGLPWLLPGSLLACLVLIGGQGQPSPSTQPASDVAQEVRAHRFIVVDSTGKERARLGMQDDGGVELVVRAKDSQAAAWVTVQGETDWPLIAVCGRDGAIVGELGLFEQTYPMFFLRDPSGQRRMVAWVTPDNHEARVDLFSKSGNSLSSLRVSEDGSPRLIIRDEEGQVRILLIATDGSSILDLWDSERSRLRAGVSQTGEPAFVVFDTDGQPVWWHAKPPQ